MGEALLRSGTVSTARRPGRGCVATALLATDGNLIASEPDDVAFPAGALTAAQRALQQSTDTAQLTVLLPNHAVDIRRLADGRYLANLFARERSEPAYPAAVVTPAVVRRSVRPSLAKSKEVAALISEPWEPGVITVNVRVTPELAQATAAAGPPVATAVEPAAAEREQTAAPAAVEPARAAKPTSPAEPQQPPEAEPPPGALTPTTSGEEWSAAGIPSIAKIKVVPPAELARPRQAQPGGELAEAAQPGAPTESARIESGPIVPVQPHGQARARDRRRLVAILLLAVALLVAVFAWRAGLRPSGGSAPAVRATSSGSPSPTAAPSPTVASAPSPTPSPAVQLTYGRSLAQGDSGGDVQALQERLRQLHYFTYPVDTGYFGDATYGAVFTFQQRQGLPTSGVADQPTVTALNSCDQACVY